MILRQGNTLYLSVDTDNIFMQWNVPLIDEIIIDMSSCLLAVTMVTVVPMVTRLCGLSFNHGNFKNSVCKADSTEFKMGPSLYCDN